MGINEAYVGIFFLGFLFGGGFEIKNQSATCG